MYGTVDSWFYVIRTVVPSGSKTGRVRSYHECNEFISPIGLHTQTAGYPYVLHAFGISTISYWAGYRLEPRNFFYVKASRAEQIQIACERSEWIVQFRRDPGNLNRYSASGSKLRKGCQAKLAHRS